METWNRSLGEPVLKYLALSISLLLAACATTTTTRTTYVTPPLRSAPPVQQTASVVTVYEEPPISQPEPVVIRWAPPPMLVEAPPALPYPGAVWVGGYWTWNGAWVWAHGHWAQPPRPGYYWVHPYYENRNGQVVFVTGYWSPPQAVFVPPPPAVHIAVAWISPNVVPGPPPIGPSGVFVPAPPGSRAGIIVPAPVGTPPAVVTSAPPVVNVGMHIEHNVDVHNTTINKVVTNNISNVRNVTNITNVTNLTIVAPPGAVATGQSVKTIVPAQAHLAAALPPVVNMIAPKPVSTPAVMRVVAVHPVATNLSTSKDATDIHTLRIEAPSGNAMGAPSRAPVLAQPERSMQAKSVSPNPPFQSGAADARQHAKKPSVEFEPIAASRPAMETRPKVDAMPEHAHRAAQVQSTQHGETQQKLHPAVGAQQPPNHPERHEQKGEGRQDPRREKEREVPA